MSKILIATMSLDVGGAETHVAELARELARRGHDVTVASAGGMHVEGLSQVGVKHYYAPLNTRRPRDMAQSLGVLSFLIKTDKYDVVHAHARIPEFLCGILRRFYKFNFVTTAHWVFISKGLEKRFTNWGMRSLAVSEDIKTYLMEKYSVPESNITVTVNGIDTEQFSPGVSGKKIRGELEIPVKAPVIVSVARLDKLESAPTVMVSALLDSALELNLRIPGLVILIAGGGNDEQRFFQRAADINMELGRNMIIMTGVRSDINEILASGDLFVGVSRAAMEAMSTGLPVILAGSEGYLGLFAEDKLTRAVETNFTCRGYGKTEAATLIGEIEAFFADFRKPAYEGRSAKLGAYGRETIVKSYSVARMVDDCIRVYGSFGESAKKTRSRRVVMSGYYGFGNAGDEAIMLAVYNSIMLASPGASITVLSKNPAAARARYGYSAIGRFNPFRVIWALHGCDALVFGGGSQLQDHTSTRSLMYYLTIIRIANFWGKPVMIYSNGIGPVTRPKNRERVRRAVESVKTVTLRDSRSLNELREMGVTRGDIEVTGDPVYSMEPPPEDECQKIVRDAGIEISRPFAVISVRKHPDGEKLFPELALLCDMIYKDLGIGIVLISMHPSKDLAASREVSALMSSPAAVIEGDFSPRELIGLLSVAQFAISMRFHTLVFAARAGTPSAGINIDPKIEANLDAFGLPSIGTPTEVDAFRAIETVKELIANREELSERLIRLSDEQRALAEVDAKKLSELLE